MQAIVVHFETETNEFNQGSIICDTETLSGEQRVVAGTVRIRHQVKNIEGKAVFAGKVPGIVQKNQTSGRIHDGPHGQRPTIIQAELKNKSELSRGNAKLIKFTCSSQGWFA